MEQSIIRVHGLKLRDFKNVGCGEIQFCGHNPERGLEADITGIFGQNGSGKTAVIEAFSLLQELTVAEKLSQFAAECVKSDREECGIVFAFDFIWPGQSGFWRVEYSVRVGRRTTEEGLISGVVRSEKLTFKDMEPSGKPTRRRILFSYESATGSGKPAFGPAETYRRIARGTKEARDLALKTQTLTEHHGVSLLFSEGMRSMLESRDPDSLLAGIVKHLQRFVIKDLFVIEKVHAGTVFTNLLLPLPFKHISDADDTQVHGTLGLFLLDMDGPNVVPPDVYEDLVRLFRELNKALGTLVPDTSVVVQKLGDELNENGEPNVRFELKSKREAGEIPFRRESSGIRRMFSLLSLLVCTYNYAPTCLVVDEIDAGIFEYLLGEILQMMEQNGRGQLIFTSHNLRPLEALQREHLVFTTTDPERRYVMLKNIRRDSNVRDAYYVSVTTESTDGPAYYNAVSRGKMDHAFFEAWQEWQNKEKTPSSF